MRETVVVSIGASIARCREKISLIGSRPTGDDDGHHRMWRLADRQWNGLIMMQCFTTNHNQIKLPAITRMPHLNVSFSSFMTSRFISFPSCVVMWERSQRDSLWTNERSRTAIDKISVSSAVFVLIQLLQIYNEVISRKTWYVNICDSHLSFDSWWRLREIVWIGSHLTSGCLSLMYVRASSKQLAQSGLK